MLPVYYALIHYFLKFLLYRGSSLYSSSSYLHYWLVLPSPPPSVHLLLFYFFLDTPSLVQVAHCTLTPYSSFLIARPMNTKNPRTESSIQWNFILIINGNCAYITNSLQQRFHTKDSEMFGYFGVLLCNFHFWEWHIGISVLSNGLQHTVEKTVSDGLCDNQGGMLTTSFR